MLKLGVIGISAGNGHPYSWAAIINGDYDAEAMEQCGYAVIPSYLGANCDTLGIDGAQVTHIWTEDRAASEHCARAAKIDHVVESIDDLVGKVDGVLLARDDPENHVKMARPFIEADLPIFIDKPLAYNWQDLDYFSNHSAQGKFVMSCSAKRYAAGLQAATAELPQLGAIELAVTVGKKDLRKYAVHYIEGLFALLGDPRAVAVKHISKAGKDILYIEFENGIVATVHVFKNIAPVAGGADLTVYGCRDNLKVCYGGTYPAFRNQLIEVIRSFRQGEPRLDFDKTRNVISTLIAGRESLENGGKIVNMKKG